MALRQQFCECCGKPALARGMCSARYQAWRKKTSRSERPPITSESRFWAKVNQEGPIPAHLPNLGNCWVWTGATGHWGYGKLRINRRNYLAHRRAYEMANGQIPHGCLILHRCDTPNCVRPEHLRIGTARDNTQDMRSKGRAVDAGALGMANSHAKLTNAQVLGIRKRFDDGELIVTLASEHGVHPSTISNIVNGRRWKHIGGPTREAGQIGRRPRKEAA